MTEDNKRLFRRALKEVYEEGTLDLADELVHPAFVDHEPAHRDDFTGPESVKRTASRLLAAFGELRFDVEDEIAEGDKVVQLVIVSGTHTGLLFGREPGRGECGTRRRCHVLGHRVQPARQLAHSLQRTLVAACLQMQRAWERGVATP